MEQNKLTIEFKTLAYWCCELGTYYEQILEELFVNNVDDFDVLYSPFEILDAIVRYEGGLANADEVAHLVDLIYGIDLNP